MNTMIIKHSHPGPHPAPGPEDIVAAASVLWGEEVLRLAQSRQLSRAAFEAIRTLTDAALDCAYAAAAERRAPRPAPTGTQHRATLRFTARGGYAHGR
jgi:hypothetical protein